MQVDFYLFENAKSFANCQTFACRLTEKAYQQGNQITIQTESAQAAQQMNEKLWTFSTTSFIPHLQSQEQEEYIIVAHQPKNTTNILLKLSLDNDSSDWQRILQIVPNDLQLKQQARELYRYYQQQTGVTLNTHPIKH